MQPPAVEPEPYHLVGGDLEIGRGDHPDLGPIAGGSQPKIHEELAASRLDHVHQGVEIGGSRSSHGDVVRSHAEGDARRGRRPGPRARQLIGRPIGRVRDRA